MFIPNLITSFGLRAHSVEVPNCRPFGAFGSLRFFLTFDLPRQICPSPALPKAVSRRLHFRLQAAVNENANFVVPSRMISNSRRI